MADNLVNYEISSPIYKMRGEKTFPRVNRSTSNNLIKYADNLPHSYFKAPRKHHHFNEKLIKSAAE